MSYTLAAAAAAAACGIKKSAILRAVKSGKVSATKDEHDEGHIEPVDCHRHLHSRRAPRPLRAAPSPFGRAACECCWRSWV